MNKDQLTLVRGSFELLRPLPKGFGLSFYERLFELDPSLRPLFRGHMENQASMFVTALGFIVADMSEAGSFSRAINELGVRHHSLEISDATYAKFGEALLWTLEQRLGEHFTPEVREAWATAYSTLADALKRSVESARRAEEDRAHAMP